MPQTQVPFSSQLCLAFCCNGLELWHSGTTSCPHEHSFSCLKFLETTVVFCVVCRATSATSHVILGQFKTCVILLGGYLLFGSDPGLASIVGAVLALSGMSVYTSLNLRGSRDLLPNHGSSSAKEKPIAEDKPTVVWGFETSSSFYEARLLCFSVFRAMWCAEFV